MTKDTVLAILREEKGYVSGEKISSLLGVSRAAVNTAVKTLRSEGYEILSATNKGYCLGKTPDLLTTGELSAYLSKERMTDVETVASVDSTNNYLRKLAFSGAPNGKIVISNEQTDGRGRRGRGFVSPKDKGIYLSILFRPDNLPSDMVSITAWTAVAVCNGIEKVCGIRPSIKWVNDLILNKKKMCGILTEMSVESESGHVQHIIIGIGINVKEEKEDFPKDLQETATSLYLETGAHFSRAKLAAEIIRNLDKMCQDWPDAKEAYLASYREGNLIPGNEITIIQNQTERTGTALEITDDFSLRVQYEDGTKEILSSGEVRVRTN